MPASELDMVNRALVLLKRDAIKTLEGATPPASQIRPFIQMAKEEVIEEYDWPQCRVIQTLTAVALPTESMRGWAYAYAIPSDCVCTWQVNTSRGTKVVNFEIGMSSDLDSDTNYIFCDDASMVIRYGSRRVGIPRLTPKTVALISIKLAEITCMSVTKDLRLWLELKKQYKVEASALKTQMANIEPEVVATEDTPELISVRSS